MLFIGGVGGGCEVIVQRRYNFFLFEAEIRVSSLSQI